MCLSCLCAEVYNSLNYLKSILSCQMLSNILGPTTECFFLLLLLNGQTFLYHSCFCSISREERWWLAEHCSNDFGTCGLWVNYIFRGGAPDHLHGKEIFCRWDVIAVEMCDYVLKKKLMFSLLEVKKNLNFHIEYLLARIKHYS